MTPTEGLWYNGVCTNTPSKAALTSRVRIVSHLSRPSGGIHSAVWPAERSQKLNKLGPVKIAIVKRSMFEPVFIIGNAGRSVEMQSMSGSENVMLLTRSTESFAEPAQEHGMLLMGNVLIPSNVGELRQGHITPKIRSKSIGEPLNVIRLVGLERVPASIVASMILESSSFTTNFLYTLVEQTIPQTSKLSVETATLLPTSRWTAAPYRAAG